MRLAEFNKLFRILFKLLGLFLSVIIYPAGLVVLAISVVVSVLGITRLVS